MDGGLYSNNGPVSPFLLRMQPKNATSCVRQRIASPSADAGIVGPEEHGKRLLPPMCTSTACMGTHSLPCRNCPAGAKLGQPRGQPMQLGLRHLSRPQQQVHTVFQKETSAATTVIGDWQLRLMQGFCANQTLSKIYWGWPGIAWAPRSMASGTALMCRSCCGNAISMPASRNALSIDEFS